MKYLLVALMLSGCNGNPKPKYHASETVPILRGFYAGHTITILNFGYSMDCDKVFYEGRIEKAHSIFSYQGTVCEADL